MGKFGHLFLTASKLARSGPTSDEIVGVFATFDQIALHYIMIVRIVHIVFVTVDTVVVTIVVTVVVTVWGFPTLT